MCLHAATHFLQLSLSLNHLLTQSVLPSVIQVSTSPTLKYAGYRTPHYENGIHTLSLAKEASPEIKTSSSLEVKEKDKPLRCGKEEEIFVKYTVVGETKGPVDIMYFVSEEESQTGPC